MNIITIVINKNEHNCNINQGRNSSRSNTGIGGSMVNNGESIIKIDRENIGSRYHRLLHLWMELERKKLDMIQIYAPIEGTDERKMEEFYEKKHISKFCCFSLFSWVN